MAIYLFKRISSSIAVLLGVSLLLYCLVYLAPSDPARIIAAQRLGGDVPGADEIEWVRKEYGLDQPLLVQYVSWLGRTVRGDLGYSIRTGNPVADELRHAVGYSLALAAAAMGLVLVIAIPAGVLAGMHEGSVWDRVMRFVSATWVSIPEFWLAFLLIACFSIQLRWLPSYGAKSWRHFILPVLSLGLISAARLAYLIRSAVLEELHQDYMRTARGKGYSYRMSVIRHALPNIVAPFVTMAAYQFSGLASGSVIIETLFAWPGVGSYYVDGIGFRDIPVIQVTALFFASVFMLANCLADVIIVMVDPRVRME